LKIQPDKDTFFKDIMRCIAEGANSIQAFERWSRHEDMRKYVNVLEEWDDIVGDDWDRAESDYLNPSEWLD
jgi:dynein heavy chain, axonemal